MKSNIGSITFFILIFLLLTPVKLLAANQLWSKVDDSVNASKRINPRLLRPSEIPAKYQLDLDRLKQSLSNVPHELSSMDKPVIELPVGNGELERFTIEESPIMAPALAAKYPGIINYKVFGIDDPNASGRVSLSEKGFRGFITSPRGSFYIDPEKNSDRYISRKKPNYSFSEPFRCEVEGHNHQSPFTSFAHRSSNRTAGSFRKYRLAMAATGEYVSAVGGNKTAALVEINNAINRVNQLYEVEFGIRLELIANTDDLFYTDSATDPYSNDDGFTMLGQNQSNIDSVIGSANYDIGHVFSTGGGGIASLGSVCNDSFKAEGVTGLSNPTGEQFYVDFVAHEIGHQFSAEHTFNGTTSNCASPNRVADQAFEPGSGSSIMSYSGICGNENIQFNADAHFHAGSIELVDSYTTTGVGSTCGTLESANNTSEPVITDADSGFAIPRKTPFILSVDANDANGDSLTYTWDQMDAGTATSEATLGFDLGDNALIRSYLPQSDNKRHFPALGTTLQGLFDDSEVLACETRSLNFRVSVRDGKGGMDTADVTINVRNDAGPFEITSHTSPQSIAPGSELITWNVANTTATPINCASVDISLLTFNDTKTTFSETVVASNQSNNGSASVVIPGNSTSRARFKIQCSDNIFYDISDADLTITGALPFDSNDNNVFYNTAGSTQQFPNPIQACTTFSTVDESNNSYATAELISFSVLNSYGIQVADDIDFFKVVTTEEGTLNILTSGTTDTFCGLYSGPLDSTLLSENDDLSQFNANCSVQQLVSPGEYYITVKGFDSSETGNYNLIVSLTTSNNSGGGSNTSSSGGGAFTSTLHLLLFILLLNVAHFFKRRKFVKADSVT